MAANVTMIQPPNKRPLRSIGHTATTSKLTKPFRSPLVRKSSSSVSTGSGKVNESSVATQQAQTESHDTIAAAPGALDTAIDDANNGHDADTNELYQQYMNLSRQLTQMRQSLDTAQQALNILKTDQAHVMQVLTDKWTCVVRGTAEELFEDMKTRAENESAWSRPRQRSPPWEDAKPTLSAEEQELLSFIQNEEHAEALKYGLVDSVEPPDEAPEQPPFTMATMLRQMDIDLDLVGYDEKEERFKT
ncbi:uncharacterized protein AB675_3946 [Cyphellophora attinorum]|uniref:Uncharacterized protein n=1 Tax=Cyphellophora attinorum TaxID=1664694 RepID=A0A0N0NK50_9EURO|nr:uncharacterized protein AB675_3946 [Phialophora attinorum]KPI37638.1 hypothetical protein AB675_3946 [Phialophora attinorum]